MHALYSYGRGSLIADSRYTRLLLQCIAKSTLFKDQSAQVRTEDCGRTVQRTLVRTQAISTHCHSLAHGTACKPGAAACSRLDNVLRKSMFPLPRKPPRGPP